MVGADVLSTVRATVESILDRRDVELVEISFRREGRGLVLRITVDSPNGDESVTLDEIAAISEEISRVLDLKDPIDARYTLEVSSAGIERPLVKPSDYSRFEGREVRVKTLDPIDDQKVFRGTITGSDDESFEIQADGERGVRVPFAQVQKANLVVDWEEELRRAR